MEYVDELRNEQEYDSEEEEEKELLAEQEAAKQKKEKAVREAEKVADEKAVEWRENRPSKTTVFSDYAPERRIKWCRGVDQGTLVAFVQDVRLQAKQKGRPGLHS